MRFDNYRNRPGRQADDRLVAIREVHFSVICARLIFNDNFRNIYVPNKTLTVDEQLVGFVAKSQAKHIYPKNQGSMAVVPNLFDLVAPYIRDK